MLTFRPVQWIDAAPLYVWRHDLETVKWSLKPPPTWDEHLEWMNEVITRLGQVLIGEVVNTPMVCISRNPGVNIMTNPCSKRAGFATEALKFLQYKCPDHLKAIIKADNEASIQLFTKCGFKRYFSHPAQNMNAPIITMEWTP